MKLNKILTMVALGCVLVSAPAYAVITSVVTDVKDLKNGLAMEIGTYTCTTQVGLLTLSSGSTTHSAGDVAITYPLLWSVANDSTVAVPNVGLNVAAGNTLQLSCAATSDTGDYRVVGEAR